MPNHAPKEEALDWKHFKRWLLHPWSWHEWASDEPIVNYRIMGVEYDRECLVCGKKQHVLSSIIGTVALDVITNNVSLPKKIKCTCPSKINFSIDCPNHGLKGFNGQPVECNICPEPATINVYQTANIDLSTGKETGQPRLWHWCKTHYLKVGLYLDSDA